jgi:hypothetical protein
LHFLFNYLQVANYSKLHINLQRNLRFNSNLVVRF